MSKFFRRESKAEKYVATGASNNNNNNKKDFSERKTQLTPLEYQVTQERQTERPYSNRYNRHWEAGTYHCVVCRAELFKSNTKFESKSGWPAFSNVVDPRRVKLTPDLSHIGANLLLLIAKPDRARTEVSCANCNAHLGHLFKDGPKPTGLRYCINSSSLQFLPNTSCGSFDYRIDDSKSPIISAEEKEFPCNPANTCSKGLNEINEQSSLDFQPDSTFRKSQTLPPMATLCLNNQSCQRLSTNIKPQPVSQVKTKLSQSSEAITTSKSTNDSNNTAAKIDDGKSSAKPDTNTSSSIPAFMRTSSSRYPSSSKGASLTAARISFFQNLTSSDTTSNNKGPSSSSSSAVVTPSNKTMPSRWGPSPTISASPKKSRPPFANRFVSSISSGSLGTSEGRKPSGGNTTFDHSISRRNSSGLFSKFSGVELISSPPVPLKETSL